MLLIINLFLMFVFSQACERKTVRKEINDMTDAEWKVFVSTIQKAKTEIEPGNSQNISIWESGAQLHNQYAQDTIPQRIHWNCVFFFWHRLFLVYMEKKLQKINPQFFFPYWDSARQWANAADAPLWKYLGTTGSPISGDIFNGTNLLSGSSLQPLTRNYINLNKRLIPVEVFSKLYQNSLEKNGFPGWHQEMELQHGVVHVEVAGREGNGQMGTMFSPLDPIFYLHHGHFDQLWLQAQAGWASAKLQQYGGTTSDEKKCSPDTPIPGFSSSKLSDVVELSNLCVEYALPEKLKSKKTPNTVNTKTTNTVIATTKTTKEGSSVPTSAPGTSTITAQTTNEPNTDDINLCPEELPKSWLEMQQGKSGSGINEIQKKILELCAGVESDIKSGKEIPPLPEFAEEIRAKIGPIFNNPVIVSPNYGSAAIVVPNSLALILIFAAQFA